MNPEQKQKLKEMDDETLLVNLAIAFSYTDDIQLGSYHRGHLMKIFDELNLDHINESKKGLYYTPPLDHYFNEVKEKVIEIWKECDNQFGYVDEKVNAIKDVQNIEDNFMYIIATFDLSKQIQLSARLSTPTRRAIRQRMEAGCHPKEFIVF